MLQGKGQALLFLITTVIIGVVIMISTIIPLVETVLADNTFNTTTTTVIGLISVFIGLAAIFTVTTIFGKSR